MDTEKLSVDVHREFAKTVEEIFARQDDQNKRQNKRLENLEREVGEIRQISLNIETSLSTITVGYVTIQYTKAQGVPHEHQRNRLKPHQTLRAPRSRERAIRQGINEPLQLNIGTPKDFSFFRLRFLLLCYNTGTKGRRDVLMEKEKGYASLNMEILQEKKSKVISSKEALKDVEPMDWGIKRLEGKTKCAKWEWERRICQSRSVILLQ